MKKGVIIVLFVAIAGFCVWLLRAPKPLSNVATPMPPLTESTNAIVFKPSMPTSPPVVNSNVLLRPDSIDEDHWSRLMLVRKMELEKNQPVEFYARVLDQDEQPIEGARLSVKLTRTDERMFNTTNFFSRKMGDEVLIARLELSSDNNGRISLTETNGSFLDLIKLAKDGYHSGYPDGNFAGVHYGLGGVRTPTEDAQMTNSWDSQKGYILHLEKN
jgi:hypothetical protein